MLGPKEEWPGLRLLLPSMPRALGEASHVHCRRRACSSLEGELDNQGDEPLFSGSRRGRIPPAWLLLKDRRRRMRQREMAPNAEQDEDEVVFYRERAREGAI